MSKERIAFNIEDLVHVEPQRGVLTESQLTPAEQVLVESVMNWQNVAAVEPHIHEVFGRSFVLKSPDRQNSAVANTQSDFAGLQVIGLGGTMQVVQQGRRQSYDVLQIEQVKAENHAKQLDGLLETREIDKRGQMVGHDASYAPLHGMTAESAARRKKWTEELRGFEVAYRDAGQIPMMVVPQLAAEGHLENRLDPDGNPLVFQVYRVPLERRMPAQVLEIIQKQGLEKGLSFFQKSSYSVGKMLRSMHMNKVIYGDSHLGNMSLLEHPKVPIVYATDLGAARDISNEKGMIQRRYAALDVAVAAASQLELVKALSDLLKPVAPLLTVENMLPTHFGSLIFGYFMPEVSKGLVTNEQALEVTKKLLALVLGQRNQLFIDNAQALFARFCKTA